MVAFARQSYWSDGAQTVHALCDAIDELLAREERSHHAEEVWDLEHAQLQQKVENLAHDHAKAIAERDEARDALRALLED